MRCMLLATCFLISSCTLQDNSRPETFGYVFHETTGITTAVLRDGKEITIQFSPDSDPVALGTLTSLEWYVLYPNSDGKRIFVEGYLDNRIQWTPNEPRRAKSEPYQEFKLANWYIATPFERYTFVNEWSPETYEKVLAHKLEPGDFSSNDALKGVNLAKFQKPLAP